MSAFPTDAATLVMLAYSCSAANFEDGQSHLFDFLSMGEPEPTKTTLISEVDAVGTPVYELEYAAGQEPWSVHDVILALVAEIELLREDTP